MSASTTRGGGRAPAIGRVAIVGAGLVGGSIALACRRAGVDRVVLTDSAASVRARARELGLADQVADAPRMAVAGAELVVLAVPAAHVPPVLEEITSDISMHAIVTDVSSLKSQLVPEVEGILERRNADPTRFVGGHPMAGSEASGPDAADGSLFQGATWVLTPTASTDDRALERLSAFLRLLGARVLALSPARHDRLVAMVSHLPQVAASCLADVAADAVATSGQAVLAVAGGGFRDTTRIAASDPGLWLGILEGNREAVLEALRAYRARLGELSDALQRGDDDTVAALLERAATSRRELVAKEIPRRAVDLVVPLDDRPGALAAAATALGEAGVNVEDLAMRHAAEGDRGALLVRVEEEAAQRGLRALRERGMPAHLEGDAPDADPGAAGRSSGGAGPTSRR